MSFRSKLTAKKQLQIHQSIDSIDYNQGGAGEGNQTLIFIQICVDPNRLLWRWARIWDESEIETKNAV